MVVKVRWPIALVVCVCLGALVFGATRSTGSTVGRQGPTPVAGVHNQHPEPTKLVVLGGSIAAGYGLAPRSASTRCGRTNISFGNLIAKIKHFRLVQFACASARSGQVLHGRPGQQGSQVVLAAPEVRGSTVIVGPLGGNDVNWLGEENTCLLHGCSALTANRAVPHHVYDPDMDPGIYRVHLKQLGENLEAIFRALKGARKILVDEYYAVTQGHPDCLFRRRGVTGATRKFSDRDRSFMTSRLNKLNATIAASAHRADVKGGVKVVKPSFAGHGVCAAVPWVAAGGFHNGATMHPTRAGQAALARFNAAAL